MNNVKSTTVEVSADMRYRVSVPRDQGGAYLFVGDLQLVFWGDPATQMAAIDRLHQELTELRDDIDRRASEPLPTAEDVLGILATT